MMYPQWYVNIVKLNDAHLGVFQFAYKEKDEIEAMNLLRSSSSTFQTHDWVCWKQLQEGVDKGEFKVHSQQLRNIDLPSGKNSLS